MNHDQLSLLLTLAVENSDPILIEGQPGIGKSAVVEEIAAATNRNLITMYASLFDIIDSKGLPLRLEDGTADFLPVGELKQALEATEPTILFIDELDKAPISTQGYLLSLVHRHARRAGSVRLPDCVSVVAATNRREDGVGSSPFMEPLKSRFTIVKLESSLSAFQDFAFESGLDTRIPVFLQWRSDLLNKFEPSSDLRQSPCERGWHQVSDMLAYLPESLHLETFAGVIGSEASEAFTGFLQVEKSLPEPDAILADPLGVPIPDDMGGRYAVAAMVSKLASIETAEPVMQYLGRLPIEFQAVAVKSFSKAKPELLEVGPVTTWMLDNSDSIL